MSRSLWISTGPDSIETEEETLASMDEQPMPGQMDKHIVFQIPVQVPHASNAGELITGRTNARTEEDNSI